ISHGGALGVKKLNSATTLIQIEPRRLPHGDYVLHRFGCSQENDRLLREGRQWPYLRSRFDTRTRLELDMWMKTLPQPWTVAMEATIFTAWIYDHLQPHAAAVKVARLVKTESALVRSLERDSLLVERVERLMTIPAVGPITALTWALEVGDVQRFSSIKKAISYCGLCGAERSSANISKRTPLSKQRNKHLQTVLIEAAKMAPRNSPELAMIYDKEKQKGNINRATLAVARKLVAYLVAVDRRQKEFLTVERENCTAA